jgi:hypothetical protein
VYCASASNASFFFLYYTPAPVGFKHFGSIVLCLQKKNISFI